MGRFSVSVAKYYGSGTFSIKKGDWIDSKESKNLLKNVEKIDILLQYKTPNYTLLIPIGNIDFFDDNTNIYLYKTYAMEINKTFGIAKIFIDFNSFLNEK